MALVLNPLALPNLACGVVGGVAATALADPCASQRCASTRPEPPGVA